jgi:cytochrome c-type biogenesis protein CcmH/NrfF
MEKRYGDYVILKTDLEDNKTLFLVPLMILIISILLVTTYTIKKSK